MEKQFDTPPKYISILLGILVFLGIYLTSHYNYLLFHSLAEIFSIVIACGIFVIAWNSRQFLDNNYLLFIGIAYLFVSGLDLTHTLAYKGMGVFHGYETNLPTQLWIATRYVQSLSLFIAPFFFGRKLKTNYVFFGYTVVTSILLISIFYWDIFPVCFIEGVGLTPFKKISEYIISLILLASIALLCKNRREFDRGVLQLLVYSIILTIVSELAFTFYIDAYGLSNFIGHFFEILAFYFTYKAIIQTGLTKPYDLLFRNLKQNEERFRNIFEQSPIGIELYDSGGKLVEINRACLEIFGVSDVMEVKGFKLFDDPNLSQEVKESLEKRASARYEAPFDFEKVREHKLYDTTKSGTIDLDILVTPLGIKETEAQMGYLVQVQDITERKKAEEKIRESEYKYRELYEGSQDGFVRTDMEGNIKEFNQAYKEMLGYSKEELLRLTYIDLTPTKWHSMEVNIVKEQVLPKGYSMVYEKEYIKKDGTIFPISLRAYLIKDTNGHPSGMWAFVRDITKRKEMEEALRKSRDELEIRVQDRTAELAKANQELMAEIDVRKRTEEALRKLTNELNERVKEINCLYSVCYSIEKKYAGMEEKLQNIVYQIPSGWQYPEIACARIALENKECRTENFKETPWRQASQIIVDGEEVGTVEVYYLEEKPEAEEGPFLKEERSLINTIAIELGEMIGHMQAEEAVKAERQRFNDVLEMLPAYVVLLTPDYHVPFANRFFRERFGESHGRRCFEYLFGRSEPCEICETYTALKTNAPHHWEWTDPDGRIYDIYDFPFTDTDGSPLIMEMGIDITERKRAEEALKAAQQYNRSLIEASLDPLVTIDAEGKVMDVNRATEIVTGVGRQDLIGSDFSDYFTDPEKAREGYQQVFAEGLVRDYPLAIRHTSSKVTDVLYNATVYRSEAGEVQGIFAAARDITERKRVEEALRESESRFRHLSSQLLAVQENERRRISREIHDSLGQSLSAIKFKVEGVVQQMRGSRNKKIAESLGTILPIIQTSIEESRRIQMDLRPSILDDLGILATLSWFCRNFETTYSHIHIEKQIDIQEEEISFPLKTVIYRISQEALNNIAKHSKAESVRLSLIKMKNKIELTIEDNGMGFDMNQVIFVESPRRGLGLTSMRERTELSGGTFAIKSTIGKGTTIKAIWAT